VSEWTVTLVTLDLEAATGVRVGGDRGGGEVADMPLLRLPDDRPYVPGSSLKGVLRSTAERLLGGMSLTPPVCNVLDDSRCGGKLKSEPLEAAQLERLCWACRTFGSPHKAGRLFVGDLVPGAAGDAVPTVVRDGVGIDRNELRAADNVKYDFEVVPPGVNFCGEMRFDDASDADVGLLLLLCDLLDAGMARVGGGTTRGLGHLRYRNEPVVRRFSASRFVAGAEPQPVDTQAARAAARTLLGEGRTP
jgi:CRISPR-associated RAMP protein (TIGR02581 family)